MKIGLSSYSLSNALKNGDFDIVGAIHWIAERGGEHMEVVPGGVFSFAGPEDQMIGKLKKASAETGVELSSYTIGANFITPTPGEFRAEVDRVKKEVDIAAALGVRFMRHDAGWRPVAECSITQFEKDLPVAVEACREIAAYAKKYGITTSVENHGYLFQGSERVHRLVDAVGMDNFRTTMDVGNFLCVDEDPVCAAMNNIGIASFVHFKDFVIRKKVPVETGWLKTSHNRYIRGSVTGFGDVDLPSIVKVIRSGGYDGFISIEYECAEECKAGCEKSINNVKALFAE